MKHTLSQKETERSQKQKKQCRVGKKSSREEHYTHETRMRLFFFNFQILKKSSYELKCFLIKG